MPVLSVEGFTFNGWVYDGTTYIDDPLTADVYEAVFTMPNLANNGDEAILEASWTINKYAIVLNENNPTNADDNKYPVTWKNYTATNGIVTIYVEYAKNIKAQVPQEDELKTTGYNFKYWL